MHTNPAASYASQLAAVKQTYASALEDASSTVGGLITPPLTRTRQTLTQSTPNRCPKHL